MSCSKPRALLVCLIAVLISFAAGEAAQAAWGGGGVTGIPAGLRSPQGPGPQP